MFIHQNIIELINERKTTLKKNEIMFKSIQIACSTFFEEYDLQLVKYEANFQDINMKYQDWSQCLIQPQTLNDAKLYVLESRIIEEEKVRLKEFQIVQENLVKLIYAF